MPRKKEAKILAADYHRNGVGGDGFYVALIADTDGTRKLVIDFGVEAEGYSDDFWGTIAVIDLDQAAAGNIYMHPQPDAPGTGGNAWRGDHYMNLRPKIRSLMGERYNRQFECLCDEKGED